MDIVKETGDIEQNEIKPSPHLDRRGGCGEAADGVVVQCPSLIEQPPRRFATPLLSRRGDYGQLKFHLDAFIDGFPRELYISNDPVCHVRRYDDPRDRE